MFQQFFLGTLEEAEAKVREVGARTPNGCSALHQSMRRSSGLQSPVLSLSSQPAPSEDPKGLCRRRQTDPALLGNTQYFFFGKSGRRESREHT